jgi:trans-aconitate 2-methyltransferase
MTDRASSNQPDGLADPWDPARYERFAKERTAPFYDLLDLVRPIPGGRAVDLGCGTGALTADLHRRSGARETLGLDSSAAMLERAAAVATTAPTTARTTAPTRAPTRAPTTAATTTTGAGDGLSFALGDLARFGDPGEPGDGRWDLVFSNAALQWVPDHPRLLAKLTAKLAAGGQLAVQVPHNQDHVSHVLHEELAAEEPYASALGDYRRSFPVEEPERYAELLEDLGFVEQHVRLQVYPHHLEGPEQVVEWARGTMLTAYQRRLPAELFERFLAEYRERLLPRLDQRRPYFYPFKRVLLWGRGPDDRAAPWS